MKRNSPDINEIRDIEGRYANFFKVGHNAYEVVVDFYQSYPENEHVRLHTRIITSPIYAKALLETLSQSIQQYEESFGKISDGRIQTDAFLTPPTG